MAVRISVQKAIWTYYCIQAVSPNCSEENNAGMVCHGLQCIAISFGLFFLCPLFTGGPCLLISEWIIFICSRHRRATPHLFLCVYRVPWFLAAQLRCPQSGVTVQPQHVKNYNSLLLTVNLCCLSTAYPEDVHKRTYLRRTKKWLIIADSPILLQR